MVSSFIPLTSKKWVIILIFCSFELIKVKNEIHAFVVVLCVFSQLFGLGYTSAMWLSDCPLTLFGGQLWKLYQSEWWTGHNASCQSLLRAIPTLLGKNTLACHHRCSAFHLKQCHQKPIKKPLHDIGPNEYFVPSPRDSKQWLPCRKRFSTASDDVRLKQEVFMWFMWWNKCLPMSCPSYNCCLNRNFKPKQYPYYYMT